MAKTLTMAGDNFLPQVKSSSAQIRELIQNKSGIMNINIVVQPNLGHLTPLQGSEVIYKDGARFLFGGFITRVEPEEIGEGQKFLYRVEVSDYSWIFNNKVARRSYANQTLKYIVEDLMDTYVDAAYGFTTTNVATGPTIETITFDHISVRKCFEKLQKLTGYVWSTDYERNLYFDAVNATPAPEGISDTSNNFETVSIAYDTSQVRNSVIVIGNIDGEQDTNTNTETFFGDGETRAWELELKPSQVVSISLNGVPQAFSLDVNEQESDVFVYSFSGQSFKVTSGTTTPIGGGTPDEIEIVYYGRIPIIAVERDPDSIIFFADLDGGDGLYEHSIKDDSITSKVEASERALKELDEFADPLVNGQFVTRTSLLTPGSIFTPGQYITVNLPSHNINTDTAFLIQEVNISVNEDGTDTEYIYAIRFGGKLAGVQEFLESLASEEGEVTDAEVIFTIEVANDVFEVEDSGLTHTIYNTLPFEYGTGGSPQGRWNMAEWS